MFLVDNYFEGSFPIELWNHYETVGPRTNNDLEVYNNKLKTHVSRAHLSLIEKSIREKSIMIHISVKEIFF